MFEDLQAYLALHKDSEFLAESSCEPLSVLSADLSGSTISITFGTIHKSAVNNDLVDVVCGYVDAHPDEVTRVRLTKKQYARLLIRAIQYMHAPE